MKYIFEAQVKENIPNCPQNIERNPNTLRVIHDDKETLSALMAFCKGNPKVCSPLNVPVMENFVAFFFYRHYKLLNNWSSHQLFEMPQHSFNSLRPSDAYMRQYKYQHWFR